MLPQDYLHRLELQAEIHARPHARIRIPALVTNVSLLSQGVTAADEWDALRQLPGQQHLSLQDLAQNFVRLTTADYTLVWERHGEFTRYSFTQPLPDDAGWGADDPELGALLKLPPGWLASLPGTTISATHLALLKAHVTADADRLAGAMKWLGTQEIVAARIGAGFVTAFTDYRLRGDGFSRYVAVAESLSETRAGRVASRLLELEIYRMMALLGLPVARLMGPLLKDAEVQLADITAAMENGQHTDSELLQRLITLAARVEGATAAHSFRFAATNAYQNLVHARIEELNEERLPGVQTFSEFLNRRFSPAMATVEASHKRLASLSERIERSGALIRTSADIVREEQNQKLLEKLSEGQRLQLRMQQTVEGLSIAAISYYALSLLAYAFKAAKEAGLQINTDIATGLAIPGVVAAAAYFMAKVRRKLNQK